MAVEAGQRWDRRVDGSLHFPRNVRILEVLTHGVHLKNKVETYWVTRRMFDEAARTGAIVLHEEVSDGGSSQVAEG